MIYMCTIQQDPFHEGQPKESRIAYQSDWLEVYEEFMSITEIKNSEKKDDDVYHHHDSNTSNNNPTIATNNIKMFNKIRTKNDGTVVVPVFPDDSFARHLNVRDGFTHGLPDVIKKYMYF